MFFDIYLYQKAPQFFNSYEKMVGKTGFEPATSCSQSRRSTRLSYFPYKKRGDEKLGEKMVARDGIEPPTRGFSIPCSTD